VIDDDEGLITVREVLDDISDVTTFMKSFTQLRILSLFVNGVYR